MSRKQRPAEGSVEMPLVLVWAGPPRRSRLLAISKLLRESILSRAGNCPYRLQLYPVVESSLCETGLRFRDPTTRPVPSRGAAGPRIVRWHLGYAAVKFLHLFEAGSNGTDPTNEAEATRCIPFESLGSRF